MKREERLRKKVGKIMLFIDRDLGRTTERSFYNHYEKYLLFETKYKNKLNKEVK
jgi:hypothetical protein